MTFGPFAFSDRGLSFRAVSPDYRPEEGEVVFPVQPSDLDLDAAFQGRALAARQRALALLRAERDRRLAATDWMLLPDAPPVRDVEALKAYRQALRDLPALTEDPSAPVWPTVP